MKRLLCTALPAFAAELTELVARSERPELAGQVNAVSIHERCRCGDHFCATFYTAPVPRGAYGRGHFSLPLEPAKGMVILDVVGTTIVCVEVLFRPDVQSDLLAFLP